MAREGRVGIDVVAEATRPTGATMLHAYLQPKPAFICNLSEGKRDAA